MLTVIACAAHLVALVGRGMAADPNRVPWGNMYEFTITGSFVVAAGYLLLRKRYGLAWMGRSSPRWDRPADGRGAVALLPIAPLTEALNSYWLVIHVMSAIIATGAFTLGGITSALYLVRARAEKRAGATAATSHGCPSLASLDRVSYRIHAFAFPVWTFAVLISGPIWATRPGRRTGTGTRRRSAPSSPGWCTPPTCTRARPRAGAGATPRSWPWSASRRCGSTSSGSTTSRRTSQHSYASGASAVSLRDR